MLIPQYRGKNAIFLHLQATTVDTSFIFLQLSVSLSTEFDRIEAEVEKELEYRKGAVQRAVNTLSR